MEIQATVEDNQVNFHQENATFHHWFEGIAYKKMENWLPDFHRRKSIFHQPSRTKRRKKSREMEFHSPLHHPRQTKRALKVSLIQLVSPNNICFFGLYIEPKGIVFGYLQKMNSVIFFFGRKQNEKIFKFCITFVNCLRGVAKGRRDLEHMKLRR